MIYTKDHFSEDQWDELCKARLDRNAGEWYRLLRTWCGYRAGSPVKQNLETLVDAWLAAHPSWRGRYL